ncbi:hypothetical protein Taro_013871, partial [Colocasia esculenta]|nr:hypothetical protein [Colocasia esculenta]
LSAPVVAGLLLLLDSRTPWETASIPSVSPPSGTPSLSFSTSSFLRPLAGADARCSPRLFDHFFVNSPSGKLVQIEYALMVVGSGQTSLGIKAANGVVIATEKKFPSILVDETSVSYFLFT